MSTHDRETLGAYALGVLDDAEVRAVDAHLTGCADCRRESPTTRVVAAPCARNVSSPPVCGL